MADGSALRLKDVVCDDAHITLEQERALLTLLSGQTQLLHMHGFMPPQYVADHASHVAVILEVIDPNCTADDLKIAPCHDVTKLTHGCLSAVLERSDLQLAQSRKAGVGDVTPLDRPRGETFAVDEDCGESRRPLAIADPEPVR